MVQLIEVALDVMVPCTVGMTQSDRNAGFKLGTTVVCILTKTQEPCTFTLSITINGACYTSGILTIPRVDSMDATAAVIAGVIVRNTYAFLPPTPTVPTHPSMCALDGNIQHWHPARIAAFALAINRQVVKSSPSRFFNIQDSATSSTWSNGDIACTIVFTYMRKMLQINITGGPSQKMVTKSVMYTAKLEYEPQSERWKSPTSNMHQLVRLVRETYVILTENIVV